MALSSYSINLRKEYLLMAFVKCRAPSLMLVPGMGWDSLEPRWSVTAQGVGHRAPCSQHSAQTVCGWAHSLVGHSGHPWQLEPLCKWLSHLPHHKEWRFANSTGQDLVGNTLYRVTQWVQADTTFHYSQTQLSFFFFFFFPHFNLSDIWINLPNWHLVIHW